MSRMGKKDFLQDYHERGPDKMEERNGTSPKPKVDEVLHAGQS